MTGQIRDFVRTRALINYQAFLLNKDDYQVFCISKGIMGALRVLIAEYGRRRVNWLTSYTGHQYTTPDDTEWDIIDEYISEFLGETGEMSTCSDFVTALEDLKTAILDSACCGIGGTGGSRGTGTSEGAGSTNEDDGATPPPGFDTYGEYLNYKCHIANLIWDDIDQDLTWLSTASIISLAAEALVIGLLTPIPGDEILALAGVAISLLAQGLLASTANAILTLWNNDHNQLVCDLYDAPDAATAKAVISDWSDAQLSTVQAALFGYFVNNDAVNGLFDKSVVDNNRAVQGTELDCFCGTGCWQRLFARGSEGPNYYFQSEWSGGNTQLIVYFNTNSQNPTDTCGDPVKGIPSLISGSANRYIAWNSAGTRIYDEAVPWTDPDMAYQQIQIQLDDVNSPFEAYLLYQAA